MTEYTENVFVTKKVFVNFLAKIPEKYWNVPLFSKLMDNIFIKI